MPEGGANLGAIGDIALDVLVDAVFDTLYLIPFLLVTYLLLEWLEHRMSAASQKAVRRAGAAGPAIGALLGAVPQCGFSAAASTLYAGRIISLGTLFAVYLSTSDEMLPIFIAEQIPATTLALVLVSKIAFGMLFGFLVDAALRLVGHTRSKPQIHVLCEQDDCHCHDADGASIFKSAVRHTLKVTLFIFVVSLVLNGVLATVGEDALAELLSANDTVSVLGAALVGLIPNCAASVAIAQLYVDGILGAGAMMAGLCSAAGVGLLVLIRSNRPAWLTVAIICVLLAASFVFGLCLDTFEVVF